MQAQATLAALGNPEGYFFIPCTALAVAAEAELSAFYTAVRIAHGESLANTAADHWLRLFASMKIVSTALARQLREITIAAASDFAPASSHSVSS